LLGILAIRNRQSLEAGFNVGREMHFHAFQRTRKPAFRQHGTKAAEDGGHLALAFNFLRCVKRRTVVF
jgi:hypothetical protein